MATPSEPAKMVYKPKEQKKPVEETPAAEPVTEEKPKSARKEKKAKKEKPAETEAEQPKKAEPKKVVEPVAVQNNSLVEELKALLEQERRKNASLQEEMDELRAENLLLQQTAGATSSAEQQN